MAKKSQFFAIDSEINAAAGVSISTPTSNGFVEILISPIFQLSWD